MELFPAIDLRHGKCVRLQQGQFSQVTEYTDDPITVAKNYQQQGAKWLHVVDLDAAKDPSCSQWQLIAEIAANCDLSLQVGGGVRHEQQIETLLSAGVTRIIIGSLAVKSPEKVMAWLQRYGADRFVLAVDVICTEQGDPMVATHGWQTVSDVSIYQVINDYLPHGLQTILCTDISRDGMLQGSNVVLYQTLLAHYPRLGVLASGGVGQLSDLSELQQIGVTGVVIGKALYERRFSLAEARSLLTE